MNENQRKWLIELQEEGVRFEMRKTEDSPEWQANYCDFSLPLENYRLPVQPIPDIPDWREACRDMQSKGVEFKFLWGSMWEKPGTDLNFTKERDRYQIPEQPIPEWREDMIEEPTAAVTTIANAAALSLAAQKLKEELDKIPHRDLQIQWHEDCLHALKTGEPMREWECRYYKHDWHDDEYPDWSEDCEYRRKPRMKKIQLWYCLGQSAERPDIVNAFSSLESLDDLICKCDGMSHKIISTVSKIEVEIPDHD